MPAVIWSASAPACSVGPADELKWAVRHWAARIGVAVLLVHLRRMRGKRTSISTAGRLTLNAELLDLPKDLGEFVNVHEFVHLLAPNHSPVFKSSLYAYLPNWETRACQLRAYSGAR